MQTWAVKVMSHVGEYQYGGMCEKTDVRRLIGPISPWFQQCGTAAEMMALIAILVKNKSGEIRSGNLPRKQQCVSDIQPRGEIAKHHFIAH